ncbi:MAG: hypothetical protein RIS70_2924, partial [Planctomycetota bacterium]
MVFPELRLFPLLVLLFALLLFELFELPKPLPLAFDCGFVPVFPLPEAPVAGAPAVLLGGAFPELPPRPLLPVLPPAPEFPPAPCDGELDPPPDEVPPRPELDPLLDAGLPDEPPRELPLCVPELPDVPPRELPLCVPELPDGPLVLPPPVPPPDPPDPATAPLEPPPDAGPFWRYSTMKFAHSWEKTLDS